MMIWRFGGLVIWWFATLDHQTTKPPNHQVSMVTFEQHIDYLRNSLQSQSDYNDTCLYFLINLAQNDDFLKTCELHQDLALRHHVVLMSEQSAPGEPVSFENITIRRSAKHSFVFGSAQSKDKRVTTVFFLFENDSVGLLSCTNLNSSRLIVGKFSVSPTGELPPFKTEFNLN
jgi:hypothetical protein